MAKKSAALPSIRARLAVSGTPPVAITEVSSASRNRPRTSSMTAAATTVSPTAVCSRLNSVSIFTDSGMAEIDRATPTSRTSTSLAGDSGSTSHASAAPAASGTATPPQATASVRPDRWAISAGFISTPARSTRKKMPASATCSSHGLAAMPPNNGPTNGALARPRPRRAASAMPAVISPAAAGRWSRAAILPSARVSTRSSSSPAMTSKSPPPLGAPRGPALV